MIMTIRTVALETQPTTNAEKQTCLVCSWQQLNTGKCTAAAAESVIDQNERTRFCYLRPKTKQMLAHSAKIPPTPAPTHTHQLGLICLAWKLSVNKISVAVKQGISSQRSEVEDDDDERWERGEEESGAYSFRHRGKLEIFPCEGQKTKHSHQSPKTQATKHLVLSNNKNSNIFNLMMKQRKEAGTTNNFLAFLLDKLLNWLSK